MLGPYCARTIQIMLDPINNKSSANVHLLMCLACRVRMNPQTRHSKRHSPSTARSYNSSFPSPFSVSFPIIHPPSFPSSTQPLGHPPPANCQRNSSSVSSAITSGTIRMRFADNLPTLRENTSVERILICGHLCACSVGMLVEKIYSLKPPYRIADVHWQE